MPQMTLGASIPTLNRRARGYPFFGCQQSQFAPSGGYRRATAPRRESEDEFDESVPLVPGEILYCTQDVEINVGMPVITLKVVNGADRPIQVGSHFHFAEVNAALEFDRASAWGKRLNVLSGGSVRFEPGAVVEVELIDIQGRRVVRGLRGLCGGSLDGKDFSI
ncbi:urease subunit beta [Advenella kashmirensis]|nr:urease subunit beta [Advenella kashmirensis]